MVMFCSCIEYRFVNWLVHSEDDIGLSARRTEAFNERCNHEGNNAGAGEDGCEGSGTSVRAEARGGINMTTSFAQTG